MEFVIYPYYYQIAIGVITLVLGAVIFLLHYKNITLKCEIKHLSQFNNELSLEKQDLHFEQITNIQKIEQLSNKIEYLNQILAETEKARTESFASAKAALFDLGGELSKQLIEIHKNENKEFRELSEKNIAGVGEKFNSEFERLINLIGGLSKNIDQSKDTVDIIKQSLLSPSGAGKLAEITLENILKSSRLRAKLDFMMQYSFSSAENTKLRPDALIFLPGGNLMVVDAKASKFLLEELETGALSKTMNAHLKSLSSREYAENILANFRKKGEVFGNIITLMFLPTEHAVEKITESDPDFLEKAWSFNILPVGPTGLMNMLSFAKFQISEHQQTENHKLIIEEVRQLLGSITTVAEYSQKIGTNLQSMVNNYDKFAASFNRNLLNKAKNIQKLGVTAGNKNIPRTLERYQLISMNSDQTTAEVIEFPIKQLEEV